MALLSVSWYLSQQQPCHSLLEGNQTSLDLRLGLAFLFLEWMPTPCPPACLSTPGTHRLLPFPDWKAPSWESRKEATCNSSSPGPWAEPTVQGYHPTRRLRAWGGLAGGATFMVIWFFWLWGSAPGSAPVPQSTLTILIWHWPFTNRPPELPGDTCTRYGMASCRLSANRSLLASADAVVFHHRELQTRQSLLPLDQRPHGQPWVWASMESPSNTHGLHRFRGIFNWVLSYRRDSDIFVPYGRLEPLSGPTSPLPAKSRMAAWVISNFQERQQRAKLYRQLAPHLQVDVFGRASGRPLCANCLLPTLARYRFYLAFENSQHRDYITEKFWRNALAAGAVPVALGPPRATYEAFVPPDAFVHVDDFSSARELAVFLVSMNESRYRGFFAWRDRLRVRLLGDWRERFCTICARYPYLPRSQVYEDLESWFQA